MEKAASHGRTVRTLALLTTLLACSRTSLPSLDSTKDAGSTPRRAYQGVFRKTGSMAVPRASHASTLLHDGRVLIVGGMTTNDQPRRAATTAEIFDPGTETFSLIPGVDSFSEPAAALLADGRVLVMGHDHEQDLAVAYDPSTGRFAEAGRMGDHLFSPSVTRLPGGKALVVGEKVLSATFGEVFDMHTGRFASVGMLQEPQRYQFTAVPLQDGRVLLTGGWGRGVGPVSSSEIYDPRTNAFGVAASMGAPRSAHAAVALDDGRVLVVGGVAPNNTLSTRVEIYQPTHDRFENTAPLIEARWAHSGTLLWDGTVLVVGGLGQQTPPDSAPILGSAEVFDPNAGAFRATGGLNEPRYFHTATLLRDGRVLVVGGESRQRLASAEIYE